ncbi:MAG: STAS/SEC14 domain-containing protein [Gammaproteobacteria bacterium]
MSVKRHGLSIGIERTEDDFFLSLKAIGKLTHDDYETITPMIESALEGVDHPRIKAIFDGTELEGWELRAAWDDFKIGLKHGSEFEKIAIYGNTRWQEIGAKVGSWFMSGEVKYFENRDDALAWLE